MNKSVLLSEFHVAPYGNYCVREFGFSNATDRLICVRVYENKEPWFEHIAKGYGYGP